MQFAKSSIFCFFVNGYFELWILPPFFFSFPFKFSWDKGGNGSSMLNCFFTVLFFFFFFPCSHLHLSRDLSFFFYF